MGLGGGTFFASKEFVFQPPIRCSMGARKQGRKALWKSCVWFCLHSETTCFIPRTEVTKCTSCHTGSGMRMRMDWKVVPAQSPCPIKAAMPMFLSLFVLPGGNPSQSSFGVATLFLIPQPTIRNSTTGGEILRCFWIWNECHFDHGWNNYVWDWVRCTI